MNALDVIVGLVEFLEGSEKSSSPKSTDLQMLSQFLKNLETNFARLSSQFNGGTKAQKEFGSLVSAVVSELKSTQLTGGTASAGGSQEDPEDRVSLLLVIDSYETLKRRLPLLHLKAKSCEALLVAVARLRTKCQKISEMKGFLSYLTCLCQPPGLGSLDQLRIELESNFNGKTFKLEVKGGATLDVMVLLPIIEGEPVRLREARARTLEQQLEEKDINASRDASLKNSQAGLRLNDSMHAIESVTLVILCLPNAMPYEVAFYEQWLLRFFLERGCYLVLWNYRGYGRSTGTPSLEVS